MSLLCECECNFENYYECHQHLYLSHKIPHTACNSVTHVIMSDCVLTACHIPGCLSVQFYLDVHVCTYNRVELSKQEPVQSCA
jgi:hypothetical protein